MKIIPYGRQHITQEDIEAVTATLQSDFLTQGPKVDEFEEKFAAYVGAKYAVAVSNGTAALHLAAMALGVNETTNVITTTITFAASANCIRYCGGNVFFADIDPETSLLDIEKTEQLIKSRPKGFFKGIVVVDYAGRPVDTESFKTLADKYDLWILQDAAHSPGAWFKDSAGREIRSGSCVYNDISTFSFHPVKHITTGEGGMITTNKEEIYYKLRLLRTHGITRDASVMTENHGGWYYEMQELGYNYRIPDILAALGVTQLAKAEEGMKRRQQIAERYHAAFSQTALVLPVPMEEGRHAYHLYVIQTDRRAELYNYLRSKNIFSQVHYIPVHLQPYYKNLGHKKGDHPKAESFYDRCLSLPMYPSLKEDEQEYVVEKVLEFFS
jgi:UDP-4-amino-4,6-dideoxy-N-acetyl-beta-L-altrosamine transaminase